MVGPGETSVTVSALERLRSGVLPVVPGQFITSGKAPLASFPGALVGFFTCMRSLVRFQVRAFGVNFFAAEKLTLVYPSFRVRTVIVLSLVVFRAGHYRYTRR